MSAPAEIRVRVRDGQGRPVTNTAVDAVLSARTGHWFPSVTKQGVSAIFQTTGNESCHVILRGGSRTGPNYHAASVTELCQSLAKQGLRQAVMVDCSHGNSEKDHRRQGAVAADLCGQVAAGSWHVFGLMLESHLIEGRQDYVPGRESVYGQSITDGCISLEQTEPLLEELAKAQQLRGSTVPA
jgi:3-deoxy-7-phosphoheptulonate synthase